MYKVKTRVPIRYKGARYETGQVLNIDKRDMNNEYFVYIEDKQKNLHDMTVGELRKLAKERKLEGYSDMKKAELIDLLEGD